jgi:hypothetical protein
MPPPARDEQIELGAYPVAGRAGFGDGGILPLLRGGHVAEKPEECARTMGAIAEGLITSFCNGYVLRV